MQACLFISPLNVNLKGLTEPNGALWVWPAQGSGSHDQTGLGCHPGAVSGLGQLLASSHSTCCTGAAGRCLLQGPLMCRDFWPGLLVTRTGISMHVWVFSGISARLSPSFDLLLWIKKKNNLLGKELLNLFLLKKELVSPKREAWGNFPKTEARKAHGDLLQC